MEILNPEAVSTQASSGVRESGRRRVKKTLGPDFVADLSSLRGRSKQADTFEEKTLRKSVARKDDSSFRIVRLGKAGRKPLATKKKLKELKASSEEFHGVCNICHTGLPVSPQNGFHKNGIDSMVARCCVDDCEFEAHVDCLTSPPSSDGLPFWCPACAAGRCAVCGKDDTVPDEELVPCVKCSKSFHTHCHLPFIKKKRVDHEGVSIDWYCAACNPVPVKVKLKKKKNLVTMKIVKPASAQESKAISKTEIVATAPKRSSVPKVSSTSIPLDLNIGSPVGKSFENLRSDINRGPAVSPEIVGPIAYKTHAQLMGPKITSDEPRTPPQGRPRSPEFSSFPFPVAPFLPFIPPVVFPNSQVSRSLQERMEEDGEMRQDLAVWTVEQCAIQFQDSHPELAQLIIEHDLLGSALLVISREQFLDLFDLPVGTALKMHAAICRLRRMYF